MSKNTATKVVATYPPEQVKSCCVCGKKCHNGWYGNWGKLGTCSRACEEQMWNKKVEEEGTE